MPETIKHLVGKYRAVTARLVMACEDAELRYYLFLKFHAIEKHSCYPSRASAERSLGWSGNKLTRVVKLMEERGRLAVERSDRQNNVFDITWYDRENEAGFVTEVDRAENPPTPTSETEVKQQGSKQRGSNNYHRCAAGGVARPSWG